MARWWRPSPRSAFLPLSSLQTARKVMVVAHPDDETFWGGVTLALDASWVVVCATHASTRDRSRNFAEALGLLGVQGLMLDMPDRKEMPATPGDIQLLRNALSPCFDSPTLERVMTHAPEGEYGHPLHRAISSAVTDLVPEPELLWYFSFDAEVDQSVLAPAAYERKFAATSAYLGASDQWLASDRSHVRLGRHEAPVPAAHYERPWELVSSIYADSGMAIT